MDASALPPELFPAMQVVGGFCIFVLGLSYAYKFFKASVEGRVDYWSGLENFGWLFAPITILITPLFVHGKVSEKNMIRYKTGWWVHLFWGPAFFLASLMCVTAGADFMNLPGSKVMNAVLTFGRTDVPPAITYVPPFTYKFPILKKARKIVFRFLTTKIDFDKSKSANALERQGVDVEQYTGGNFEDEEDEENAVMPINPAPPPASTSSHTIKSKK